MHLGKGVATDENVRGDGNNEWYNITHRIQAL